MSLSQTHERQVENIIAENQKKENPIKRTKRHEAILKLKEVDAHITMMKKRQQYLQVKDEENRSKTIQHERKLQQYQQMREGAKKDKKSLEKYNKLKMYQREVSKQKSQTLKNQIHKRVTESLQKFHSDRVQAYEIMRRQRELNESRIEKIKELSLKENKDRKRSVNQIEEASQVNISRYREKKQRQANELKDVEYEILISKAEDKQKELQRLAKLEQQMIKKNSESMQVSQAMKNRLKEVLGVERKFAILPSIHSKNNSLTTRGSTGNTQVRAS